MDGTFERSAFTYDHADDHCFCPTGKMLITKGTLVTEGATLLYRANWFDRQTCDLKERCTPREPSRKVSRTIFEEALDMARDIMNSDDGRAPKQQTKKV